MQNIWPSLCSPTPALGNSTNLHIYPKGNDTRTWSPGPCSRRGCSHFSLTEVPAKTEIPTSKHHTPSPSHRPATLLQKQHWAKQRQGQLMMAQKFPIQWPQSYEQPLQSSELHQKEKVPHREGYGGPPLFLPCPDSHLTLLSPLIDPYLPDCPPTHKNSDSSQFT